MRVLVFEQYGYKDKEGKKHVVAMGLKEMQLPEIKTAYDLLKELEKEKNKEERDNDKV